jgi:hypothetical protein
VIVVDPNDSSRKRGAYDRTAWHVKINTKVQGFLAATEVCAVPQEGAVFEIPTKRRVHAVLSVKRLYEVVTLRRFG